MILLKKVRLVNWYGFTKETAPIGFFTLIAGKNGNGKSVMLDAIKYAAYGDVVFNKSSESKGSRTLSSYTRGLLDATAGTCMRPVDRVPTVYSHIVLEYFDDVEEKSFLLGTVIETNPSNNCQTYRYAADHMVMERMDHVYTENGSVIPYSPLLLQKKYKLTLMNREQALPKFMQMTGLKLTLGQLPTYLRKMRGIMSYDPNARIDQFIRESVLEKRDVDFGKLIEAKENIERLNESFEVIQSEITELEEILHKYDDWESERNRLLSDDIRIVYKKMQDINREIARQESDREGAQRRTEDLAKELEILSARSRKLRDRLVDAKVSFKQLDSTQMINEEEKRLEALTQEKQEWLRKCQALETFQRRISELLSLFTQERRQTETSAISDAVRDFLLEDGRVEDLNVLASLCQRGISSSQKAEAVLRLKGKIDRLYDRLIRKIAETEQKIDEINRRLDVQNRIVEESKKHRNTYESIPEYVALRDEINREYERRGLPARAKFACEYVISLKDESWRDAVEAFLGPRRYTILVEPDYYDIADDVLNRSEYRYAHLFNTKLLMKREVKVEPDSVVSVLEIKNPVAQKYFDFQLGRMHAVSLNEVRNYENAIAREGRVAVAMDSYFLRFNRLRSYYLGEKIFELNRIRAEKEIARLGEEKRQLLNDKQGLTTSKSILAQSREFFGEYDYDAHEKYQDTAAKARESEEQLRELKRAQETNQEFLELSHLIDRLTQEQETAHDEFQRKSREKSDQETVISRCEYKIEEKKAELEIQEKQFKEYQIEHYTVVQKVVEAYEKYLSNDKKGTGGLLAEDTRKRIQRSIEQQKSDLMQKQADYNAKHSGSMLPCGTEGREEYAARRDKIWMDNLQEIRQKLEEQTRRYEDIFKNEFVLTILKSCERARDDLKQINYELGKLNFAAKYQFDVHYVHDGSDYAKIIEYARFLDEREQLGGGTQGQMTLGAFTSVSDEEGEQLEQELERIVNQIIKSNSEETIARFADYRNYMTYEILISNQVLDRAKLSRQTGFNSGAEVQIPYLLILCSALLMIYNQRVNSTRLVFIDEPFAKMDPGNVKLMLDFMREQHLQVIFCSPDKTESIGNECEVILPALRVSPERMRLGIVQFHEEKAFMKTV
ncbi:MAG: hypothetical protein LIP12_09675 [Clostridiales bacterium]|nr:hypothetical protein [Clostridiales bacterium]